MTEKEVVRKTIELEGVNHNLVKMMLLCNIDDIDKDDFIDYIDTTTDVIEMADMVDDRNFGPFYTLLKKLKSFME